MSVVVRRHDGTIGASIENGDEILHLERRERPFAGKDVAAFADRPDDIPSRRQSRPRPYRQDPVIRPIEGRSKQLSHPSVEHGKLPVGVEPLDVYDARDERTSMADNGPSRLENRWHA